MDKKEKEEMERLDKKNIAGKTNLEEFQRLIELKKQKGDGE